MPFYCVNIVPDDYSTADQMRRTSWSIFFDRIILEGEEHGNGSIMLLHFKAPPIRGTFDTVEPTGGQFDNSHPCANQLLTN